MTDPVAIGGALGAGLAAAFAAWSHFFSQKHKRRSDDCETNGSIRHANKPHVESELAALKVSVDELKDRVGEMSEQLTKIQRSIGRLEGRSSVTNEG